MELKTLVYTNFYYILYGVPSVSKIFTNAILVYHPLIYKYDIDLSKYLPDLFIYGSDLYMLIRFIYQSQIYIPETDLYIWV